MNFTETPPTEPGFYAWKYDGNSAPRALIICKSRTGKRLIAEGLGVEMPVDCMQGNLWCRLLPADEGSV